MTKPTLAQIFGTGAVRLANGAAAPSAGLFIPDTALQAAGLGTPTTGSAEGHLVAVALNAKAYLTQTNFDANTEQALTMADGYASFTTRGTTQYRLDQITLSLAKIDTGATLDPDNY
ncbi:MAG: hypothetical protein KME52_04855 [Desmonostoc geniculatum HA4340-LM1]|jgi:hypothetical protein|nr:hypothetical protein [Desmonostoc geniculatum HA4340-LM1]